MSLDHAKVGWPVPPTHANCKSELPKALPLSKKLKNKPKLALSEDAVLVGAHLFNCSESELTGEHLVFVSDALNRTKDLMKPYTESELVTLREEYAYLVAVLSD